MQGYRLLEDLAWHGDSGWWVLHCRLTIGKTGSGLVPVSTDWCVLIADSYPRGCIKIFPAAEGGITATFPHQLYNAAPVGDQHWREGLICVTTPNNLLGKIAQSHTPYAPEERLSWYIRRALLWLEFAFVGELRVAGGTYEIPHFPLNHVGHFAFSEDPSTLNILMQGGYQVGTADTIRYTRSSRDTLVATRFLSKDGQVLREIPWGSALQRIAPSKAERALWLLLDSEPLVGPWQVPVTIAELRRALASQCLSFDDLVLPLCNKIRDGRSHLLLVGFPIPETIGGPPIQLHWQAMQIPSLTRKPFDGFRENKTGFYNADKRTAFCAQQCNQLGGFRQLERGQLSCPWSILQSAGR